jgi:hypothetical protein
MNMNNLQKAPSDQTTKKATRVTLDLSPGLYARLKALETLVEADSKAGVIRQALQVYEYIAERSIRDGARFRIIETDGKEENVMFFIPSVRHSEQTK